MNFTRIQIIVAAVAALVLGGGGFVAGMTLAPAKADTTASAQASAGAQGANARGAGGAARGAGAAIVGGGGQTAGRVLSVNDGSLTVEVRTPGSDTTRSVIVLIGGDARLVKTVETDIKLSDIKVGDQVVVAGTTDQTTGTVSASAVILGANALQNVFGGFGGGGAPGASGAPVIRRPGVSASPSARP